MRGSPLPLWGEEPEPVPVRSDGTAATERRAIADPLAAERRAMRLVVRHFRGAFEISAAGPDGKR